MMNQMRVITATTTMMMAVSQYPGAPNTQSRYYLQTSDPTVGTICILGAPGVLLQYRQNYRNLK